jgi:hypothetical protein
LESGTVDLAILRVSADIEEPLFAIEDERDRAALTGDLRLGDRLREELAIGIGFALRLDRDRGGRAVGRLMDLGHQRGHAGRLLRGRFDDGIEDLLDLGGLASILFWVDRLEITGLAILAIRADRYSWDSRDGERNRDHGYRNRGRDWDRERKPENGRSHLGIGYGREDRCVIDDKDIGTRARALHDSARRAQILHGKSWLGNNVVTPLNGSGHSRPRAGRTGE